MCFSLILKYKKNQPPKFLKMTSKQKYIYLSAEQIGDIKLKYGDKITITVDNEEHAFYYLRYKKKGKKNFEFASKEAFFEKARYVAKHRRQVLAHNRENNDYVKYINSYKLQKGCENPECKCGGFDDACQLTFDHITPNNKEYSISTLMYNIAKNVTKKIQKKYFDLILSEISKCRVLCHNCHTLKTKQEKCGREKLILSNSRDISEYTDRPPVLTLNYEQ